MKKNGNKREELASRRLIQNVWDSPPKKGIKSSLYKEKRGKN